MSDSNSSSERPVKISTFPAEELSSGSGAPSVEDLDTTPTPSEVENDSYHQRVPRKDPEPGELGPSALDMNRPSKITEDDLALLRQRYSIPIDIALEVPGPMDRASQPDEGSVALLPIFFECGLRLPMQRYFAWMLAGMELAPCQLSLNSWRILAGIYVVWHRAGLGVPCLEEVKRLYRLKSNPKTHYGWYYLSAYDGSSNLVQKLPDSNKNFKDLWFWATGDWGRVLRSFEEDVLVPDIFRAGG